MAKFRKSTFFAVTLLIGATAFAQQSEIEAEEAMRAAEEKQRAVEIQMREAEERLAEAARKIADLSSKNLPAVIDIERRIQIDGRAVLGINIGGDKKGPVEGVTVQGVSPGGAAADAGLRSGDIITAVNGESMTADSDEGANAKLVEFMSGVEDGDVLDVEYLRKGKQATVEVSPRRMSGMAFAFNRRGRNFTMPLPPHAPDFDIHKFAWFSDGSGWGHMEMVELTKRLGSYFGTDEGLLVVRAPEDENLKLEDGDVIQSIDGREPNSVSHAMRILGSYQSGEELEVQIMRDKRKQTLKIEMPDNRSSRVPGAAPHPRPDVVVVPAVKVRVEKHERT